MERWREEPFGAYAKYKVSLRRPKTGQPHGMALILGESAERGKRPTG